MKLTLPATTTSMAACLLAMGTMPASHHSLAAAFSPAWKPTTMAKVHQRNSNNHRINSPSVGFFSNPNTMRTMMMMPASGSETPNAEHHSPELEVERNLKNPKPALFDMAQSLLGKHQSTVAMGAAMAFMVAMLASPLDASAAASGGRMGGSFSSSRSAPMSRAAPRSYSTGRSYSSGGYYGGGSRTIIAPTYSPIITPGLGFGYSPFYYGGGPGVMAVSRGPGFFDLLLFGGILFAVANVARGMTESASSVATTTWGSSWGDDDAASPLGPGTSLVQLSVGMEVPNRDDPNSLLSALDRLSSTARTDSRVGIQSLTSQVALEILRRRSSIVSASSSYKHYRNNDKAIREFQSKSVAERSKFEQEQVSKFGGVDYASRNRQKSASASTTDKATMAVITLILAIDGDSTKISGGSIAEVEDALRRIAADSKVGDCLQSAEILWTPVDRSETLTARDVVADYPELRTL
eukprot:CAMPEP_0119546326 /NCGR_PEP_ID=MMETSP1352-20130426/797_1 /TAXON_ID=265584 /ORGANISM="Stauroneis constricta, Strain CCMP1120" /LENGTH=465 /DNA_ID=CAMNT_0007591021 /DNA_START=270 /DNA_END=1667 /DNA_ORIENTATION=+